MKHIVLTLVVLFTMFFLWGTAGEIKAQSSEEMLEGTILEVNDRVGVDGLGEEYLVQDIEISITRGSLAGSVVSLENNTVSIVNTQKYKKGDRVVVMYTKDFEGNDLLFITDYVRRGGLLSLFILFSVLAIVVGGLWGMLSLVGMAISFVVIFKVILPQILQGSDPVVAAISGSILIIPATFYLSHGIKRKTHLAIVSTFITIVITGILATLFVDITNLTGFASEEAAFLQFEQGQINMKGLLLAGILIGTLGVLDDITISQASIVNELQKANSKMTQKELFLSAMRVGRDHIASLVNTLVLVYTGASLPLLLLFLNNTAPFIEVINLELIADEIVRTLVGSIGLIVAVPISTMLSISFHKRKGV